MRLGVVLKIVVKIALFLFLTVFLIYGIRMDYGDSFIGSVFQLGVFGAVAYIVFFGKSLVKSIIIFFILILLTLYPSRSVLLMVFFGSMYLVISNRHVLPYVYLSIKSFLRRIWRELYGLLGGRD